LSKDIGKVIPSFSVLSESVVLTIPIYLIILSYKLFLPSYRRPIIPLHNSQPAG
jgi:hypothetical protein